MAARFGALCDPKELRARASKLLAFALSAKELGIEAYAMALIKLAHEVLAQARASIALPFDARSGAAGTGRRSRSCFPGRS
jgi:hypothetical protein